MCTIEVWKGEMDSHFTEKTVKHSDGVKIWGSYSGKLDRGGFFFFLQGERYINVLEEHLLSTYANSWKEGHDIRVLK